MCMKKAVIFDIDGVLAEKSPDRDFRDYHKVIDDLLIKQIVPTLDMYMNYLHWYEIIFITGRKEYCRDMTMSWLITQFMSIFNWHEQHATNMMKYHYKLFMRGDDDYRKAEVLKKEIYDNHIKGKYDVEAVYEDDIDVCRMWKKEGLFVFHVGTRDDF